MPQILICLVKFVSFSYSTSAYTDLREKQDTSSHYIKNNSGFDLWVESLTSGNVNKTVKGYAIIPSGTERRIRNTIKESGYSYCKFRNHFRKIISKWKSERKMES